MANNFLRLGEGGVFYKDWVFHDMVITALVLNTLCSFCRTFHSFCGLLEIQRVLKMRLTFCIGIIWLLTKKNIVSYYLIQRIFYMFQIVMIIFIIAGKSIHGLKIIGQIINKTFMLRENYKRNYISCRHKYFYHWFNWFSVKEGFCLPRTLNAG